jgi:hypothetical protein
MVLTCWSAWKFVPIALSGTMLFFLLHSWVVITLPQLLFSAWPSKDSMISHVSFCPLQTPFNLMSSTSILWVTKGRFSSFLWLNYMSLHNSWLCLHLPICRIFEFFVCDFIDFTFICVHLKKMRCCVASWNFFHISFVSVLGFTHVKPSLSLEVEGWCEFPQHWSWYSAQLQIFTYLIRVVVIMAGITETWEN